MSTAGQKAAAGEQRSKERAAFQWDDPFLLEDQLTEDERMIRDTARDYAQDKLAPRVDRGLPARKRPTARSSARWARSACSA